MYKPIAFLILSLLTIHNTSYAQQAESSKKFLPANLSRTRNIDVKHIAIDLKFDWKKKQAYGTAAITFSPLNATDKIFLDAGILTINSIELPDRTPLKFICDGGDRNDGLEINLGRLYQSNENVTIKINYHTNWVNDSDPNLLGGSFGKGIRFFEPTQSTPIKRKQIWSQGEAESNRYWFPCYDSPDDVRTTEFTATVDKGLTVISNGILLQIKNNPNGTHTFHYKADKPYPNYLTSFVVGEYIDVKQNYNEIPLHTFCYPDEQDAAKATTVRLPDMVKFFSEKTGMQYPYSGYSQVVVQDYPFPGMTGQHTATTISDNMIDDAGTHADFLYLWDGVESNALASQWFGNCVSAKSWGHTWLNKSFARYFEGLYADYKNGHDEYLMWYFPFDMGSVMGDWNAGYRHPIVTYHFDNLETFTTDNYANFRGALVLRMLRKQLGEEKWWKAIRHYVKTNAFKQVTTTDLQQSIKTATGEQILEADVLLSAVGIAANIEGIGLETLGVKTEKGKVVVSS